ncbi:MAG: 2-polyprenyl-3-methyl-6-methoxy-1,4-benzoquinone monooxygenase [Candidatus Accumulibacter sp. UW26]
MSDRFLIQFDKALRTLFVSAPSRREVPGSQMPEATLSAPERTHAGALMRVNHVGEVCAQALYQGQALTCRDQELKQALAQAASEETDHLAWTERRLRELGSRTSLLNPLWYLGALGMGMAAGKLGDRWSLGFLAETERQVEAHLDHHLTELPNADKRSRAIVAQMRLDEISHAETAVRLGASELPASAIKAMQLASGVMTRTAYYL